MSEELSLGFVGWFGEDFVHTGVAATWTPGALYAYGSVMVGNNQTDPISILALLEIHANELLRPHFQYTHSPSGEDVLTAGLALRPYVRGGQEWKLLIDVEHQLGAFSKDTARTEVLFRTQFKF